MCWESYWWIKWWTLFLYKKRRKWFLCDDNRVAEMDENKIISPMNYYLIYKKAIQTSIKI